MATDLSKQTLWVSRRASTSPIDSPSASPTNGTAVSEQPEEASDIGPLSPISGEPLQLRPRRDSRVKNTGRRIAQIVKLRPECVEAYKACHANVWPEVLKQIRECNIRDYSIFHDPGTNILFATFVYVGYGFADDMERMRENPKVREWWKLTDGMQESFVEGAVGSAESAWWREAESVFYTA